MKFLNFCVRNKVVINIITVVICVTAILIIDNVFHAYRGIQWSISLLGCSIMWFVSFCIIDDKKDTQNKKNTDNSKQPKRNKNK